MVDEAKPMISEVPLSKVVDQAAPIVYGIVQPGLPLSQGVSFVQSRDVGGDIDVGTLQKTSAEIAAQYRRSELRAGDILFSLRGNIGESSIASSELSGANIARGIARIRVRESFHTDYVRYALQAPETQRRIARTANGSTFRELSIEELRKLQIPAPPYDDQRSIAEILHTWDEAIEKLGGLRGIKSDQLIGLTQRLVGRGEELPNRWELRPLSAISTRITRQNSGGDHPVMTISAKTGFLMQSDKFSRDMAGRSVERYTLLHEGEFAYNKGNSQTAPYGCIFRLDRQTALVPFVYFCSSLNKALNHEFYTHLFAAGALHHQLSRLINSGVRNDGLLNLYANDFFSCKVPVPPADEQEKIASVLTAAKDLSENY
jgi:type I restriction enzyme, S subunit